MRQIGKKGAHHSKNISDETMKRRKCKGVCKTNTLPNEEFIDQFKNEMRI